MTGKTSRSPLARKLARCMPLGDDEAAALEALPFREEEYPAGRDVLAQGARARHAFLVTEGMAMRYRMMADGGRQILGFLIAGDMSGGEAFVGREMDHAVAAATPLRLALIEREAVLALLLDHPRVGLGMLWASMQEEAILREHVVALGRRDARGRVAYLLCEMLWRLQAVGLAGPAGGRVRITQTRVADSLGLTPVHVNRVLRQFQRERLVGIERGGVVVEDWRALRAVAELEPDYLHLTFPCEAQAPRPAPGPVLASSGRGAVDVSNATDVLSVTDR